MDSIQIIIVLYKKKISESATIKSLMQNVVGLGSKLDLFIYDNSPNDFIQENILNLSNIFNINYIRDTSNPGVSKAYNEGALYAQSMNKGWILLFDQDTFLPSDFISTLIKNLEDYPTQTLFAPRLIDSRLQISPCKYKYAKGFPYQKITTAGIHLLKGKNLLNSCLCIQLQAFSAVGGYRSNVQLYYSDFVFINFFKKVYSSFVLLDIDVIHSMSALEDNYQKQLQTYSLFCIGSRAALKEQPKYFVFYFLHSFMRCFLLCFRYKKVSFLAVFFNHFLLNRNAKKSIK